jgi:hypothetical protein
MIMKLINVKKNFLTLTLLVSYTSLLGLHYSQAEVSSVIEKKQQNSMDLKIDLGKRLLSIQVRDPELKIRLEKTFGAPTRIPFNKDNEVSFYESYVKINELQELRATLVANIKDLIDDIALEEEKEKFSDLLPSVREKLYLLASLREQIGLNWAETYLTSNNIKRISLSNIEKLLGREIVLLIHKSDIEKHFCHPEAPVKASDCKKRR